MIGRQLGGYELKEEIGRGGMGIVYRAIQPSLGRTVAVKVLLPQLTQDAEFVERFLREARAAAQLDHPSIVTIHDVGEFEGTYFFSMQYLLGQTLDDIIQAQGRLPMDSSAAILGQMADALGYAHEAGVVHRDVKAANIIVDQAGRALLTDFGIARAASDTRLTRTGAIIGSPEYMSPEQISGKGVDHRTDLYSLGIVAYQMLTGSVPYSGDTAISVAYMHVNEPVRAVCEVRPEISPELDGLIQKLMSKDASLRYQSAPELVADLGAVGQSPLYSAESTLPTIGFDAAEIALEPSASEARAERRPSLPILGLVLSVIGLVTIVGLLLYFSGGDGLSSLAGGGGSAGGGGVPGGAGGMPAGGNIATTEPAEPPPPPTAESERSVESAPALPAPPPTVEPARITAALEVISEPPGAEIWADGAPLGLTTPATVPLAGEVGAVIGLELRRGDEVIAGREFMLGATMDERWAPSIAVPTETLEISSLPAGAAIRLDGELLDEVTPATVEFAPGERYQLSLRLDGYEPAGWTFALDDLNDRQRQDRTLHFPLTLSTPPGFLIVRSNYPVDVSVAGKKHRVTGEQEIALPEGTYEVQLAAPEVLFTATETVTLASEGRREISPPRAVAITVAANPSNCRLKIDGRDFGYVPVDLQLVPGTHAFEFLWEGLGESLRVDERIGPDTKRIFHSAPRP